MYTSCTTQIKRALAVEMASASLINSRSECSNCTHLKWAHLTIGVDGSQSLSISETVWRSPLCFRSCPDHRGRQGNYSITILATYLAQIPSVLDELRRSKLYGQIDDRDAEALAEEDELVALNDTPRGDIRSSDRVRLGNLCLVYF